MIFSLSNANNSTNVYHRTRMQKIKWTPKRSIPRKPPSNTGNTVSAATWRHQLNTLPQVAPTPRVKWLTVATERRSSSDSDVDLDSQIDILVGIAPFFKSNCLLYPILHCWYPSKSSGVTKCAPQITLIEVAWVQSCALPCRTKRSHFCRYVRSRGKRCIVLPVAFGIVVAVSHNTSFHNFYTYLIVSVIITEKINNNASSTRLA